MIKIQNKYSYSEDDLIGEGAYSKVYKGLIDKTQEFVAIKVIDWSKVQDKYYVSGFQREVRILRDLDHQNIVKIIEMFHDAGQNREYLIMEYCDSQNLKYFLFQSGGVLSENVTKIVLQQLLTALNELIKKEYLHRDIKPENILIHQRTLKLADFGFSVKADYSGNQLFRENVGTPLYMAPQILENKHYSTKCDIWSIGIMTYQLITGDYPWMGDDPTQLLKSIKSQKLSFPLQIQISQEFKEFIINCLQFEEKDRYNWDDLLDHKIFKTKYVIQKNQIKIEQLQLAIDEIRQVQKKRGTPVEQLFTNLDMDGDKKLTFEEFQALLLYVDKQMEINIQKGIFYKYGILLQTIDTMLAKITYLILMNLAGYFIDLHHFYLQTFTYQLIFIQLCLCYLDVYRRQEFNIEFHSKILVILQLTKQLLYLCNQCNNFLLMSFKRNHFQIF